MCLSITNFVSSHTVTQDQNFLSEFVSVVFVALSNLICFKKFVLINPPTPLLIITEYILLPVPKSFLTNYLISITCTDFSEDCQPGYPLFDMFFFFIDFGFKSLKLPG